MNITGRRFGKLIVLGKGESKGPGRTAWNCRCDCGQVKTVRGDALKSGNTKSCGNCRRSGRLETLFTFVPVPVSEVCRRAKAAGLTFGQYVAKEYVKNLGGA